MTVIDFAAHRSARQTPMVQVAPRLENGFAKPLSSVPSQSAENPKDCEKRSWLWQKAEMRLLFLENLRSAASYARILSERYGVEDGREYKDLADYELLDGIRDAQAMLLLTPVYRKADLEKKHRIMKHALPYLEIDPRMLERELAADAAYLAIPKRARRAAH